MVPYIELKRMAVELTNRFNCLLYGSLGLQLTFPQVLDEPPHDADFLTADSRSNVLCIIDFLHNNGYRVWSWKDPVVHGFDCDLLYGRLYLRASKPIIGYEPAVIDIIYEVDDFVFQLLSKQTVFVEGIRVLNKDAYIRCLGMCEKEKHLKERQRLLSL